MRDFAIAFLLCVLIACLTIGINFVRPPDREPFFFWWGIALIPACITLPLSGRYNTIAAWFLCLATFWLVIRYLSDWDAGIGLPGLILGFVAIIAVFATLLSWAYSRGHGV